METAFAMCSLIFGGVFERLPKLRWAFAHGGGAFPGTIGRIEHGFHVRPDLVAVDNKQEPRTYCGKFWVDSLVHDPVALKLLSDLVGPEKIVCGSDYPFPLGEDLPGDLVQKAEFLSEEEKQKILWKNGLEFLGVTEDRLTGVVDETKAQETKLQEIKEKLQETIKAKLEETIKQLPSLTGDQDAEKTKTSQESDTPTVQPIPTAIVIPVS